MQSVRHNSTLLSVRLLSLFLLLFLCSSIQAQIWDNLRKHTIPVNFKNAHPDSVNFFAIHGDSVFFDTLSIVPGSFYLMLPEGRSLDTGTFHVNPVNALLIWNRKMLDRVTLMPDSVFIYYRVFPTLLSKDFRHKDIMKLQPDVYGHYNPFEYHGDNVLTDLFKFEGLTKSGSISRGVTFGNNQDVVLNSSLNLQLAGKMADNVELLAAITDENIPMQPEGNTQQLQEFDKVFIQVSKEKTKLIVGDFELLKPPGYFMNFRKKAQGGLFSTEFRTGDTLQNKNAGVMRIGAGAAISKGKFSRNVIPGIEGNQGPYRLKGANNELYIMILSGSEKVFLDGIQLTRGQDNDYVIDYNASEIIFTPKHMITKDSRIAIEFQYSEKSYARSMIYYNTEYEKGRYKLRFHAFSEQDSKNQPLLQSLSKDQKQLLADSGDSLQNALWPAIDSVAYTTSEVLYMKKDTLINPPGITYTNIFVYSSDSTIAHYRLGFTNVGLGNGNYIQIPSALNGRVFQWVAPLSGVKQGNFEPVILLIAPQKQQLFTLGSDVQLSKNSIIKTEIALSNRDINLYSSLDKKDNSGIAVKAEFMNTHRLSSDTNGWKLKSGFSFEHVQKTFNAIERYRPVEFERDWNVSNASTPADEDYGSADLSLLHPKYGDAGYSFKIFQKGSIYKNYMHIINTNLNWKKFKLISASSLLDGKGIINQSRYLRNTTDFSRSFKKIMFGVNDQMEDNRFYSTDRDTLRAGSYMYDQWSAYISSPDSSGNKYRFDYGQRQDFGIKNNNFVLATLAENISGNLEFNKNPLHRFSIHTTYRKLQIIDSTLSTQEAVKSILNRFEHSLNILKSSLSFSTFYEIGSGQEQKKEFTYIQVQPGQGLYEWNDFNGDGIKQLNEFQVAVFPDRAIYIKVYTPTNEYIKAYTNQFNEVISINPSAVWGSVTHGSRKFASRVSDQLLYRTDHKTTNPDWKVSLNPFSGNISDSALVNVNSTFRNTFYFNRSNPRWGWDYAIGQLQTKNLLTNGYDSRVLDDQTLNIRWNMSKTLMLSGSWKGGSKKSTSDYFPQNNYRLATWESEPKLNIQPGSVFRITFIYKHGEKFNNPSFGGEVAIQEKGGVELRYSAAAKGTFTLKFNYVSWKYNASENTPIANDMLEGLKIGANMTWGINLQRNLASNTQLTLNYDGRKSEGAKAIHTGGVQLRAFF